MSWEIVRLLHHRPPPLPGSRPFTSITANGILQSPNLEPLPDTDELSDVSTCSVTNDNSSDTVSIDTDNSDLDSAYSTDVSETRLRRRRS